MKDLSNLDSAHHFALETLDYSKRYFPFQADYPMMILARVNSKLKKYDEAVIMESKPWTLRKKTMNLFF